MAITDAATDVVNQGSGALSKIWKAARGTIAAVSVSTAIAVATGGVSLSADAVLAAGESIAATGAIPISPTDMLSFTGQGLAHNLGGIADGAVWPAEGIQNLLEPSIA